MMSAMTLRRATPDDAERLLAWRNDERTRQFSFSPDPVALGDHLAWLERRLAAPDTRLWIAEVDGEPVGQVRAERRPAGTAELHIAVAPHARGRGLAAPMLAAASTAAAEELGVRRVVGLVMGANAASRRAFERAGFAAADPLAEPLEYVRDLLPAPVVAIVQARMGSTRLPGKVLMDVAGRPALAYMLDRVRRAATLDAVWVATTDDARDDAIAEAAEAEGVPLFRGSEHDVLGRYAGAAEAAAAGTVVRLTADCPLIDPAVIDAVVGGLAASAADLATNAPATGRTYPDGMDVEAMTRATLDTAAAAAVDPLDREHVTRFLRTGGFRVHEVHLDRDLGDVRITVDTIEDLALVRRLAVTLGEADFTLEDVLRALERDGRARSEVS